MSSVKKTEQNDYEKIRQGMTEDEFESVLEANYVQRYLVDEFLKNNTPLPCVADDNDIRVLSLDYRRVLMDEGEVRQAIVIPKNLPANTLEEDVRKGAYPFQSLLKLTKPELDSRVTFIRAKSLEYGLTACCYLTLKHDEADEIDTEQDYWDPDQIDLEAYSPLDEGGIHNLIPILRLSELCDEDDGFFFGFGNTGMKGIGNKNHEMPYWKEHSGPIIIHNDNYGGIGSEEDRISDAIGRIKNACRIFVITVESQDSHIMWDEEMPEESEELSFENPKLLRAIVKYDGASIDISSVDDDEYWDTLLGCICKAHGMIIPTGYPRKELIHRLHKSVYSMHALFLNQLIVREVSKKGPGVLSRDLLRLLAKLNSEKLHRLKGWKLLDSLDGINEVKKEIRRLVNHMKINKARKKHGMPAEPIVAACFLGAPGTSKTTCAQALADILADEKLLPFNRFKSVSGSNLQAAYVGQTSMRVRQIVESHDVILIDEAYSLSQSKEYKSPYAGEALAELCMLMTESAERGGDKLFIFAGYGGESSSREQNLMRDFLESNPGIKSRISAVINFPSYSPQEMSSIFMKICKTDGFNFGDDEIPGLKSAVESYFSERISDPSFGNGREAHNLLSEAMKIHSDILEDKHIDEMTEEELSTITLEDVEKAIISLRNMELARNGKRSRKISLVD